MQRLQKFSESLLSAPERKSIVAQSMRQTNIPNAFLSCIVTSGVFESDDFHILFSFAESRVVCSFLRYSMDGVIQVCGESAHKQSFQRTTAGATPVNLTLRVTGHLS